MNEITQHLQEILEQILKLPKNYIGYENLNISIYNILVFDVENKLIYIDVIKLFVYLEIKNMLSIEKLEDLFIHIKDVENQLMS